MPRRDRTDCLNDRERILLNIINGLQSTIIVRGHLYHESEFRDSSGDLYTHFAHYRDPLPGELVLCNTGGIDRWKVAWFVRWIAHEHGLALLREIGSDAEYEYGNEKFLPVVGMRYEDLLERERYRFLQKVYAAFRRGGSYVHRYSGIEFPAKHEAVIWVRGVFSSNRPYPVSVHWTRKTSVAAILRRLKEEGYGARKFEPATTAEDPGALGR